MTWEYYDSQGAEPFTGSQTVIANKRELHVKDIRATSEIKLLEGGRTEDFAAWLHLGYIWRTPGNFSIPRADPAKYRNLERQLKVAERRFELVDKELNVREARGENVKKQRRRWSEDRAAAMHGPLEGTRQ